jgi:hypothetical protein
MIAEGGFSAVVEPSLETERSSGCSTLGNDGRVWERVSVMEVHQICDEKNGRDAVMIAGCAGDYFSTVLMSRLRQRYQQAIER